MKIKSIKALWGMDGTLESQFERIAAAGYEGVESPLPHMIEKALGFPAEEKQFRRLLERYKLDYIAMIFSEQDEHNTSYREQVEHASSFGPIMINSHSARDKMTFDEQAVFFDNALMAEQKAGVRIGHETHRGRAMFTPWTTAALIKEFTELKLTADFSHWVCVCESLLEDQKEYLDLAIERTIHIHARVGYSQGPQVPHPAAPEYDNERIAHEQWWKQMVKTQLDAGAERVTFTPEFGPNPYMQRLPFTNQPVSNLWEICNWMKKHFQEIMKSNFIS